MIKSTVFVADKIELLDAGKVIALGLYTDGRVLLQRPDTGLDAFTAEQPGALPSLSVLLCVTGLEAGTYPAHVELVTPSGAGYEQNGGRRANVLVAAAGACNLVLNFAPFLIVETGDYTVRATLAGQTLEGTFHVAFDSVASVAT
jgi:hypothetical protein